MTIINNIEIDDIQYHRNTMKEAIVNNDPIDDKLHVVICISNPCLYARRYILIKEFMQRMELEEPDVVLYVIEYAYKNQRFIITDLKNPTHLQVRTEVPLWHKENMINVGIRKLLPANWKAVAWIDSDIEFENVTWVKDTLKILNGTKDIVQLFSHCVDMNQNGETMNVFTSFGHQYVKGVPYSKQLVRFWHPGYAWACTKKAYEKMGGLFDKSILGSGDNIMALSIIQKGLHAINSGSTEDYKQTVCEFQDRVKTLRLGYVPGVIRHYYHGSKKNRRYHDRWQVLLKHNFSPNIHTIYTIDGVITPSKQCPRELLDDIMIYFQDRNEDEFYQEDKKLVEMKKEISFGSVNSMIIEETVKAILDNNLSSPLSIEIPTEEEIDNNLDDLQCPPCPTPYKSLAWNTTMNHGYESDSENEFVDLDDDVVPTIAPWHWLGIWDKFIGNE